MPPAAFSLGSLEIVRSLHRTWNFPTFFIKAGEDATITAIITNYGGQVGTYTANLLLNGEVVATQDVDLSPGQDQTITFELNGNEPGEYTVEIGGLTGQFSSVVWINWWLIIGLALALGLFVWAGWYFGYYKPKHMGKT